LNHQNNYVKCLSVDNAAKSFSSNQFKSYIIILMIQTKLLSALYVVKFLDTSVK